MASRPYPNLLGAALSDVYAQPTGATAALLEREGVNLRQVRTDTLRGHLVWVIGAAAGDSTSPQLWVEQERLVLLRIVEPIPTDIAFNPRLDPWTFETGDWRPTWIPR